MNDPADLDNQDAGAGGGRPDDPTSGDPLDDLIGAYLLDALTDEEREAFEAHLLASAAAQDEVARLRPIVGLLPLTLDGAEADPAAGAGPSPDLRARILAAAHADHVRSEEAAGVTTAATPAEPVPTGIAPAPTAVEPVPLRPRSRGVGGAGAGSRDVLATIERLGWSRLAAAIFAVIAAGALIWALVLQGRLDDRDDELADLAETATAEAGGAVVALTYVLQPTADGPAAANGVLFPLPDNPAHANLNVLRMPALPEGQAYQLWFVRLDAQGNPAAAIPSVTFGVDDQGHGSAQVPLTDEPFDIVAVTQEPAAGSQAPTAPILMTGAPGTAAG